MNEARVVVSEEGDSQIVGSTLDEIGQWREVLQDTLSSSHFKGLKRQRDLLSYLVTETIEGRSESVDTFSIAVNVFGRGPEFDPTNDSITRVEMHRLRASLIAWNSDAGNPSPLAIILEQRQYRPNLVARVPLKSPQQDAGSGYSLRELPSRAWRGAAALMILFCLAVAGGYWSGAFRDSDTCRSQRPGLVLPQLVAGTSNSASSKELLTNLELFLDYYPLLKLRREGQSVCPGVPQFALKLENHDDPNGAPEIEAILTNETTARPIWKTTLNPSPNSQGDWYVVAMAQLAYLLGDDDGAVQKAALSATWEDKESQSEFKCLMLAHHYYIKNGESYFEPARSCLIQIYDKSKMADVPAMLGALELEEIRKGIQNPQYGRNYLDLAVKASEVIDPHNSELLMLKLRMARVLPNQPIDVTTTLISLMTRIYPYEPNIMNQIGIAQTWRLGQLDATEESIDKSILYSRGDISGEFSLIYQSAAAGKFEEITPYLDDLLTNEWHVTDLLLLRFGDEQNRPDITAKAMANLKAGECKGKRSCYIAWLDSNSMSPQFQYQFLTAINQHFPQ